MSLLRFQSTPSVKRATFFRVNRIILIHISIHTLCEEGDSCKHNRQCDCEHISIHTLCEEGDTISLTSNKKIANFNPHPLWRGRHLRQKTCYDDIAISIHTLCEEGDYDDFKNHLHFLYFNPHPLWRGRPWLPVSQMHLLSVFQSTPSVKRATHVTFTRSDTTTISIHTLCEEGDVQVSPLQYQQHKISIHTLCEEGDSIHFSFLTIWHQFQSTPSVKRATILWLTVRMKQLFQSTPSVKRATEL